MDKVDEMLGSMAPAELAALEVEIDKRADDLVVGHYYERGRALAREAVDHYEKTGEIHPALHLVKSADEPLPEPAAEDGEGVDAALDQLSEEELKAIEDGLDADIDQKSAVETAAFYYKQGQEYARATFEGMKKESAAAGGLLAAFGRYASKNPGTALAGAALGGVAAKKLILDK
jgi:hypothetical protein